MNSLSARDRAFLVHSGSIKVPSVRLYAPNQLRNMEHWAEVRATKIAAGQCAYHTCTCAALPDHRMCTKHLVIQRENQRRSRANRS